MKNLLISALVIGALAAPAVFAEDKAAEKMQEPAPTEKAVKEQRKQHSKRKRQRQQKRSHRDHRDHYHQTSRGYSEGDRESFREYNSDPARTPAERQINQEIELTNR